MIRLAPFIALLLTACAPDPPQMEITDAWARATAAGQSAAVYATITSTSEDALTGAATPRAGMAMIHVGETVDGVARMRHAETVTVPAGGTLKLAPGGTHVMLMDVDSPLTAGEIFPLTLTFAKAGPREVSVAVVAPGSR